MLRRFLSWVSKVLSLEERVGRLAPTFWGDATETYAKSKIAVNMDGTAYATTSGFNDSLFNGSNPFSVSFWNTVDASNGYMFSKYNVASAQGVIVRRRERLEFFLYDGSGGILRVNAAGATDPTTSVIYGHFCVTYSGATGTSSDVTLYINGSPIDAGDYSVVSDTFSGSSEVTDDAVFGGRIDGASLINSNVDQLKIIDKELDASEVSTLYNSTFGLNHKDLDGTETFYNNIVAWYDFNTPTNFGRNVNEESHAVSLETSGKYLSINNSDLTGVDFSGNSSFSVGFWLYLDNSIASIPSLFEKGVGSDNTVRGYIVDALNGSEIYALEIRDSSSSRMIVKTPNSSLIQGAWHHLIFSYDHTLGAAGVDIYINGSPTSVVEDVTTTFVVDTHDASNAEPLYIGDSSTLTKMRIDECFLYNSAINSTQAITLYHGGVVAPARTLHTDNLVSDWSFNAQNVTDIGKDSYGSNDLTPNSIVDADLVGGKDSLDLTEVSINSTNATLGHVEGKAAGFDGVTLWTDRSTNGNNAQQLTIANTALWKENVLNGEGVLEFDGVSDYLDYGNDGSGFLSSSFSLNMLLKLDNTVSDMMICGVSSAGDFFYLQFAGASFSKLFRVAYRSDGTLVDYRTQTNIITDTNYHMITLVGDSSDDFDVYVDGVIASRTQVGVALSGVDMSAFGSVGNNFLLMDRGGGSQPTDGSLAQFKIFNKALDQTEIALIKDYYNDKYALSL